MPTLPAARNRVFRRNQSIFMAPRMRFSRNALVSALTAPRNRHNGKLFRGDLAGRLAATLKNSLKRPRFVTGLLRFRKAGFYWPPRLDILPRPTSFSTGWKNDD